MATKNFLPRLNLLSWLEHITKVVVQLIWRGQTNESEYHLLSPRLNHSTQCVPSPEVSSRFIIAHSFRLGFFGKVSLKKAPQKFFKPIFFTASSISKLLRGLFGRTIFSTLIIYSKQNFPIYFPVSGTSYQNPNSLHQNFCMFQLSYYILLFQKGFFQTHLQKFHYLTTLLKPCFESS